VPGLNIQKLCARYERHTVLDGFSPPTFEAGRVAGIAGPNAAGKSTLVKALAGFVHDLNLALRYCDEILFLKDGRQAAHGSPADIVTPELLREVYAVDARVETCSTGIPYVVVDAPTTRPNNQTNEPTTYA